MMAERVMTKMKVMKMNEMKAPRGKCARNGKAKNLINIAPLDEEARFMDHFGWLHKKSATDPDTIDQIIGDLKERKFLVYVEQYPHVYPHCWRSGDELVFRLVEEWYINMDW